MWGRNRFILSFVLVALVAPLAYGVIVFATTMRVLDQVSHDEARSQWQALRRALHTLPTDLLRVTQDYAYRPEISAPTILAAAPINAPDAREGDAVLLLGRPLDNVVMDQLKGIFGRVRRTYHGIRPRGQRIWDRVHD